MMPWILVGGIQALAAGAFLHWFIKMSRFWNMKISIPMAGI